MLSLYIVITTEKKNAICYKKYPDMNFLVLNLQMVFDERIQF